MTTQLEITLAEKQVMDVFTRCTGFFNKKPKRETERTIDMIWRSVEAQGFTFSHQEISDAVMSLIEEDLLSLDEHTGHISLTDEGYRFVCGDVILE